LDIARNAVVWWIYSNLINKREINWSPLPRPPPGSFNTTLSPELKAKMCDPNNPKFAFVNTTESNICGLPKSIKNITITTTITPTPTLIPKPIIPPSSPRPITPPSSPKPITPDVTYKITPLTYDNEVCYWRFEDWSYFLYVRVFLKQYL
jgi:hypothetical protein